MASELDQWRGFYSSLALPPSLPLPKKQIEHATNGWLINLPCFLRGFEFPMWLLTADVMTGRGKTVSPGLELKCELGAEP